MPVSVLILAAALAQGAPAEAALPDILIPQLRLGMDKEQFHALWPKYRAAFGPGCTAKIDANIRDHKVYAIALSAAEKEPAGACGKFVHDWAYAAFGKPKDSGDHDAPGANCAPGNGIGYSALAQSAACGAPDVEDWASWEPQDRKYHAGLGVVRKSGIGRSGSIRADALRSKTTHWVAPPSVCWTKMSGRWAETYFY